MVEPLEREEFADPGRKIGGRVARVKLRPTATFRGADAAHIFGWDRAKFSSSGRRRCRRGTGDPMRHTRDRNPGFPRPARSRPFRVPTSILALLVSMSAPLPAQERAPAGTILDLAALSERGLQRTGPLRPDLTLPIVPPTVPPPSSTVGRAAVGVLVVGIGVLGMNAYGGVVGSMVGAARETACFGGSGDAARIGRNTGMAIGVAAFGIAALWHTIRGGGEPESPPPPKSPNPHYVRDVALGSTAVAASIGMLGGAFTGGGREGCAGAGVAAVQGAVLYGAAGLVLSPIIMVAGAL